MPLVQIGYENTSKILLNLLMREQARHLNLFKEEFKEPHIHSGKKTIQLSTF